MVQPWGIQHKRKSKRKVPNKVSVQIIVPYNYSLTECNAAYVRLWHLDHAFFLITSNQCWSESGLVSPAVSPSPQCQSPSPSPSPSPSGQSPSPSGVNPSPLDQSPSPSSSPLDQSPSPSPVGQSPSPSPWVRTQPGLMSPTIEKCFILILL